jgi:hypothetical protein
MKKVVLLAFVGLWCLVLPSLTSAQDPQLLYVDSDLWMGVWDVAVAGDYAYCAMPYGLQVLDISNPAAPLIVARLALQRKPLPVGSYNAYMAGFGLEVEGDYAYLVNWNADGLGALHIIDISNPSSPRLVSDDESPHYACDIKVSGGFAYVAQTYSGLNVFDVSNPNSPSLVGSCPTNYALGVTLAGQYAYVADGGGGLRIIDISEPASPVLISTCNTPGYSVKVYVDGGYAFVADASSGLQIVDVSNPLTPQLLGSLDVPHEALDVVANDQFCFVLDDYYGLQVVNVANPAAPFLETSFNETPFAYVSCSIEFWGNHVLVGDAEGGGLEIIDLTFPVTPVLAGYFDDPGGIHSVAIQGTRLYATDGLDGGLRILDISDPHQSNELGMVETPDFASDVATCGDYAYIADRYSGLSIVNISDSTQPVIVSSIPMIGYQAWAFGVVVSGNYAYVGANMGGLQIVDITDPAQPAIVGIVSTPGLAGRLAVAGNIAFVTYWGAQKGLSIIDVTNPAAPISLTDYPTLEHAYEVAIDGNYAYLGGDGFGVLILDVANPVSPVLVGTYALPDRDIWGIKVAGDYLYISNIQSGLRILDITNRTSPVLIDSAVTRGQAFDVAVLGSSAYVADRYGLSVFSFTVDCDSDEVGDTWDNCPLLFNPDQADIDADGWGDICDNCPDEFNPDQSDSNANGLGDVCELVEYRPGDANMYSGAWPPMANGLDVVYLVGYFKGQPLNQRCLVNGFYCAADVNGDCRVVGTDVTYLVNYLKGNISELRYCPDYPPAWLLSADLPPEPPAGWPNCEISR